MKLYLLFPVTCVLLWCGAASAQGQAECFPTCRDGYLCHQGKCISKCNPPCSADQQCTAGGVCTSSSKPSSPAQSQEVVISAAVKSGLVLPTEVYVEDVGDVDTEQSLGFGLDLDMLLAPRFSMGVYLLVLTIVPEDISDEATFVSLGITLRPHIPMGDFEFRPGLVIGYNSISSDFEAADDTQGLNMGLSGVIAIPSGDFDFILEPGFYSQPVGGNDDYEITFAPSWYLFVGIGN